MNVTLLEKLLDAGFSKAEILQLARDEPGKDDNNEGTDSDESASANESPAENKPAAANESPAENESAAANNGTDHAGDAVENRLSGIEQKITGLMKMIQTANLRNDSFSSVTDSLEEQTDKIMAGIIRPEVTKKG